MRYHTPYYKCTVCGCSFTEDEKDYIIEDCGECFGIPAQEKIPVCPHCHSSDIADAKECIRCGEVHTEEEMDGDLCDNCKKELAKKYRYDIDACLHISDRVAIQVPRCFADMIDEGKLNELIADYLHGLPKFDAIDFIEENDDWFCEEAFNYEEEVV